MWFGPDLHFIYGYAIALISGYYGRCGFERPCRLWIEIEGGTGRSRDPSLRVSQLGGHADGDGDRDRGGRGREGDRDALQREGERVHSEKSIGVVGI